MPPLLLSNLSSQLTVSLLDGLMIFKALAAIQSALESIVPQDPRLLCELFFQHWINSSSRLQLTFLSLMTESNQPLRILSLDGGGVRGMSSLYILKGMMAQMRRIKKAENQKEKVKTPRPCDVFDLICGTSTGGLIALLLGRLEMVRPS